MKANELRIGNYVHRQSGKMVVNRDDVYKIENVNLQSANKYEPIPLTEEWILNFGFDVSEGLFGESYTLNNISIWTSSKGNLCFCWDRFMKEIKTVHELQNLYFALTGEELSIK